MKTTTLHKNSPSFKHLINPENPFFRVIRIEVSEAHLHDPISLRRGIEGLTIKFSKIGRLKENNQMYPIFHGSSFQDFALFRKGGIEIENEGVSDNAYESIELTYEHVHENDIEILVHYETIDYFIDIANPFDEFAVHLQDKDNTKILFSAPFGQGKTTFLNYFFEKRAEYEVFKLYPVNYSISHNEDIFKYIKVELLFQLLGRNVEFDRDKFPYFKTVPAFLKANAHTVLAPFLLLLPKVGKTAYDIYDKLNKLKDEYFDYHEKNKKDDKLKAVDLIKEVYEKEGSVFEDNFYTQLIRYLLAQLKEKSGKENVLIIDDTDRMDPDHVFRIFNVFAAHFDSSEYDTGLSNKFGLDKIVIVGDYSNLYKIFTHRFGPNTDFASYINKYFSTEPFIYNNKNAIVSLVKTITNDEINSHSLRGVLGIILADLLFTDNLTLREAIKFKKLELPLIFQGLPSERRGRVRIVRGETQMKYKNSKYFYFNVLHYLSKLGNIDILIEKLKKCKEQINYEGRRRDVTDFSFLVGMGFIPFVIEDGIMSSAEADYTFTFNKQEFVFRVFMGRINDMDIYRIKDMQESIEGSTFKLREKHFYEILIENAIKFKELGGIGE
jgi:hypothetical protein